MIFKNKILAAGLAAIIAGFGIFAAGTSAAQAQTNNDAASPAIAQMMQMIETLQQQIQQIIQLIAQLKPQETCGNGICRFGETATSCPTDCGNNIDCQSLWWSDNRSKICQQKRFCGSYMYYGLKTFETQAACQTALDATCSTECKGKGYALGGNYCVANSQGVLETCCCTGIVAKCGNGQCESDETMDNCLVDCGLRLWPEINTFDTVNNTFSAKNIKNNQYKKIITNKDTKYYVRAVWSGDNYPIIEQHDFQWFYSTLKNWSGPEWSFLIGGTQQSDGSIVAAEISLPTQ